MMTILIWDDQDFEPLLGTRPFLIMARKVRRVLSYPEGQREPGRGLPGIAGFGLSCLKAPRT
jgi:hypothetical protein